MDLLSQLKKISKSSLEQEKKHAKQSRRSGSLAVRTNSQPVPAEAPIEQLRAVALDYHSRAWQSGTATACYAIVAGRAFMEIKDSLPHGKFNRWIAANVSKVSKRTVERYMQVAAKWPQLMRRLGIKERVNATDVSQIDLVERISRLSQAEVKRLVGNESDEDESKVPPSPDEWLTPVVVASLITQFFEVVDLDPCAADGEPTVSAQRWLTRADDGLNENHAWTGKVWLNPGRTKRLGEWIKRVVRERESGSIAEALILTPVDTEAKVFAPLHAYPRVHLGSRLLVKSPLGNDKTERRLSHASMIVLVAHDSRLPKFAETFGALGDIYVPYRS